MDLGQDSDSLPLVILISIDRRERGFVDILFDGVKNDSADNDHAAEDRPDARAFLEKKKNPDRIQERFDKTDDARIERTDAACDADRKKDVSDPDLKNPEIKNGEKIVDLRRGRIIQNDRQHEQNDQKIAVKNRERRIFVFERARMPQKDEIQTEENARSERREIAGENVRREIVCRALRFEKKQTHPGETNDDRDQIRNAKFFL